MIIYFFQNPILLTFFSVFALLAGFGLYAPVFSGDVGIERVFDIWIGWAGSFFIVFNEFGLVDPIDFFVITGLNFPLWLDAKFKFAICLSTFIMYRPLSRLSIISNCEKMSFMHTKNLHLWTENQMYNRKSKNVNGNDSEVEIEVIKFFVQLFTKK